MAIMAQPKIHGYLDILNGILMNSAPKIPQTTDQSWFWEISSGLKSLCLYYNLPQMLHVWNIYLHLP